MSNEEKQNLIPLHGSYFRDEMNLAEFPLASLDSKTKATTLVFEDTIRDSSTGQPVTRKLTVAASASHGLPSPLDEEVLLGLLQLTAKEKFTSRTVHFSRYELIKELGWKDHSKSYKRIEDAINRWVGVTLYYDNAWWNKEEKSWVSKKFHILEDVTLFDKETRTKRVKAKGSLSAGRSSFTWNQHVFDSFVAGHLRKLDFQFLTSLKASISKRMFRFLDKRFYRRPTFSADLRDFACEHIGLSREYSNAKLKAKLKPAIAELVEKNFLSPMPDERRFVQERRGVWRVFFSKAAAVQKKEVSEELTEVALLKPSTSKKESKKESSWVVSLLSTMSNEEREALLAQALLETKPGLRKMYETNKETKGALYQEICTKIVKDYLEKDEFEVAIG